MGGQRHVPAAFPPGKTRYPLYRRLGVHQSRSGQVRKISPPTGILSPDRQAHSESLYRLSYSSPRGPEYQVLIPGRCQDHVLCRCAWTGTRTKPTFCPLATSDPIYRRVEECRWALTFSGASVKYTLLEALPSILGFVVPGWCVS